MIRAENLALSVGIFRLEGIDISVGAAESFFLLGPSGAGKTLVLEALLGLRRARSGRVLLDGEDVTALPPEARRIAYVPQDLALFPHLSVRDNILFGLRARAGRAAASAELDAKVGRWVELLELGTVVERRDPGTLSGGERQRVALARALVTEPRVLFMDEPFSALDAPLRRRLQTEFRALQRGIGLTLVQVTHDPEEAFLMADRVGILMDGRLEQTGSPGELWNRPSNLRVARFLMLQNLFPGRVRAPGPDGLSRIEVEGALFAVAPDPRFAEGAKVVVGIRPEEVILVHPDRHPEPERRKNLLLGEVQSWADLGHYRLVRLAAGALCLDAWLNIRAARELPMEVGSRIWFHVRPGSFCLLPAEEG